MRRIILLILFISIILFLLAPNKVDKSFCWLCLVFYIIEVVTILRIDLKSKIYAGFNVLFFLSFFLTSFAYPLFVYDTPADRLNLVGQSINFNYLSKCSALCLIASSIYTYGYLKGLNLRKCLNYSRTSAIKVIDIIDSKYVKMLYIGIFVALFSMGVLFLKGGGSVVLIGGELLTSIFESIFPVVLLLNSLKVRPHNLIDFIKKNLFILLLCLLMIIVFIRIGDRGLIFTCGIQIVVVYIITVKRLKLVQILPLMIVGAVFMFTIRQMRMLDNYTKESSSISSYYDFASSYMGSYGADYGAWYYLSDLTNISQELCLGFDYSQKNGLFHPFEEIILNVSSPIPLLPSFISNVIFGHPTSEYNTSMALNKYMAHIGDANFGNHCVIDVYMCWGILGVLLVFYYFGYAVAKCYSNLFESILFAAIYILLVSHAVYIPRNMVLSLVRPAVYVWFFVWIAKMHKGKSKLSRKQVNIVR